MSRIASIVRIPYCIAIAIALFAICAVPLPAADEFGPTPSWDVPQPAEIRGRLLEWLDVREAQPQARRQIDAVWAGVEGESGALLERLIRCLALVEPQAAEALLHRQLGELLSKDWQPKESLEPLVRDNLRLYYGVWLARASRYDEATRAFAGLEPAAVVDPASLLFYRAACAHQLVDVETAHRDLATLLEREDSLPWRYQQLATLMRDDLSEVKADSLDHISRRMNDIQRRLGHGQSNQRVVDLENGVIESLDKMIEELEKQQQQASAGASAGGQSGTPADESRIMTQKGPGKVGRKNIGQKSGWGTLPPRERERTLQQISQQFPSQYREAIEQYFRKIAAEQNNE